MRNNEYIKNVFSTKPDPASLATMQLFFQIAQIECILVEFLYDFCIIIHFLDKI